MATHQAPDIATAGSVAEPAPQPTDAASVYTAHTTTSQQSAVEVDDLESQAGDSTFGDGESETQSISSSILAHTYENGRRYHAYRDGKYLSPNDEKEADRLDIYHHILLLQLEGTVHLAPLGPDFSGRVLDLGAGTGIWAMDMGDKYPSAEIIGIDLSPTQADWVPPNVYFEVDDMEEPWTYSQKFDFIHAKWLVGSVRDFPKLMRETYDNLNPGGWCEFQDWDYTPRLPDGTVDKRDNWITKWHGTIMQTCEEKTGASASPGPLLKNLITNAGFTNITEVIYKVPAGPWAKDKKLKEVGKFYGVALEENLESISLRLMTMLGGWTLDEVQVLNANFRREMREVNFYHLFHVVYGQKPMNAPS